MVESNGIPGILPTTRRRFYCDECGCECDPEAYDPREWLFRYKDQELCWECVMCDAGIEKRE